MIALVSAIKHAPVLIAGHDPAALVVLEKAFLDTGHSNIKTTSDLREIRPLYNYWSFDLVIVDVHLPDSSTLKVMNDLQGPIHDSGLAVVAIVNRRDCSEDRDIRRKLLELGVRDFIFRPFEQKECLGRIHTILENKILFARQRIMETGGPLEAP